MTTPTYPHQMNILRTTLPLLYYLLTLTPSVSSYKTPDTCQVSQQVSILNTLPPCQARPTLVDVREMFTNLSEVVQIVPDHVTVPRCGGSCYVPTHTCMAQVRSTKVVQVMLVMSKWPHGEHETVCIDVELDVHHECECGCKVQPEQCLPDVQYYHEPSCR